MHAGIGAAGTLRQDCFSCHAFNGRGQCALDCGRAGLNLPAAEFRAVVGQDNLRLRMRLFGVFPPAIIIQSGCNSLQSFTCLSEVVPQARLLRQLYYLLHFAALFRRRMHRNPEQTYEWLRRAQK